MAVTYRFALVSRCQNPRHDEVVGIVSSEVPILDIAITHILANCWLNLLSD